MDNINFKKVLDDGELFDQQANYEENFEKINQLVVPKITDLETSKVDKETGKGLSTNDYTTTEKNKLAGIPADTAAQLADIAQDTPIIESLKYLMQNKEYVDGRLLIFEDHFEGDEINVNNWYQINREDNPNNELQYYTNRKENAYVNNSNLIIKAIKENYGSKTWTSAKLRSNKLKEYKYGRIEAKIKMPLGQGLWPAFWTLGTNLEFDKTDDKTQTGVPFPFCGEMDIMEHVNSQPMTHSACHWGDENGNNNSYAVGSSGVIDVTEYHIYAIEWTEDLVSYYVDDYLVGTFTVDTATTPLGYNGFKIPHFMTLNLAVGGNYPGAPDLTTPTENLMYIDFVRVYALPGAKRRVNATALNLDNGTINLSTGGKKLLTATILPSDTSDQTVTWESSDESVAIVGGGYVTAKGAGNCVITAKTNNGLTATCAVNVIYSEIVFDNFNRTDNLNTLGIANTGQTWVNKEGTIGIIGNKAYSQSAGGNAIAVVNSGIANAKINADLLLGDAVQSYVGIVARYVDGSNYFTARLDNAGLALVKMVSGTGTILFTESFTPVLNQEYNVKLELSGSELKIYLDDVLKATVTDSFNSAIPIHGLRIKSSVGDRIDNFIVDSI